MEDGSVRAKIFGNIGKTFEIASKIKGLRIYTDVAEPKKNQNTNGLKIYT